jgi:hypothetical protein
MNGFFYNEYSDACSRQTDINLHLTLLYKLANSVKHVTEFGVRDGQSTRAFLAANCILRSYDLYKDSYVQYLFELAQASNLDKEYIQGSSLEVNIEPTDLLFIDTDHNYNQLRKELALHHNKISKYIVMHDTTTYGGPSQGDPIGLLAAVMEFLADNKEWRVMYHSHENNGLTVLERI